MPFENEILDLPARVNTYRDAGYDRVSAAKLARQDQLSAAIEVLKEDYATPVAVDIASLEDIPVETAQEVVMQEKYETASELHALTNACRRHRIGFSDRNYRLMAAIQNSLVGRHIGDNCLPKMEDIHARGISPSELTVHMEDTAMQSLKDVWAKIKQSFINGFNRLRSWYIKAFDGAARLGKKAAAVKQMAEAKQGQVKNSSFDFGGLKNLSIQGKAPEPAALTTIIQNMAVITQNVMGKNAEYYNKLADNLGKTLEELIKSVPKESPTNTTAQPQAQQQQADFTTTGSSNGILSTLLTEIDNVAKSFQSIQSLEPWTEAGNDSRFKDVAAQGVTLLRTKDILPGDKMFVVSSKAPNSSDQVGQNELKDLKLAVGMTVENINPNPREMQDQTSFKTLNTSQVVSICDSVMTACKAGLDYKLLFASREKAFAGLEKTLENVANQASGLQGKGMTFVRANISATTTIFGKINSGEARWYRYAMGVFSKSVDYCQQSLNQIQ